MATTLTEVDLWNIALDHIVEKPLSTTSDDSPYARWLNRNYAHMRRGFLRLHPWNWAITHNTLTADATAPAFRYDYRYALPSSPMVLRVIEPTVDGVVGGYPIPYELVTDQSSKVTYFHCDDPGPLYLRLLVDVSDLTIWDELAADAFALTLAERMARRFQSKQNLVDDLTKKAATAFRVATEADAQETPPEPLEQSDVVAARYRL